MAKFHEKALALFAVPQLVEGQSAIRSSTQVTGTVTTSLAANTITGVGTQFLTELTPGAYLYNAAGTIVVGRIAAVTTNTAATLEANALAVIAAAGFSVGLGAKNALAVLNFNYTTELDTEAFQYLGDELNRDEETSIKDKYCKLDFETFLPSLGTIAGTDPVISEVPLVPWMTSSGMALVLSTGSLGFAKFTNGVSSNVFLSIEVRRSSPDLAIAGTQKVYQISDARGNVDLDVLVGTKGKLKFNYQGNLDQVVEKVAIVADFSDQKTEKLPAVNSRTITVSELDPYITATEPTITNIKNFCFDKINAANWSGFEYQRFLTSCVDGWSKGATPTDVNLTILEDIAAAAYNPFNQLETNHVLALKFGSVVGKKAELIFHKLQLAKITSEKMGAYVAQGLSFRNVGVSDIILK